MRRLAVMLLSLLPVAGWAQTAAQPIDGANTAWVLTATGLVLFMTLPGLAMFYGGLVRSKNVLTVFVQCFAITCVASLLWYIAGYSLAFSEGSDWLGGISKVLLSGVTTSSVSGTIPESVYVMFQMTFAVITPALIVGGFAERMKFSAVLVFSSLWLLAVYVPVCHWVWGGGWLQKMGLLDFAGGTVVHITAGGAALVAAVVVGRRKGFPNQAMPPHNLTMTASGAGMLWFGWFGFNGGSALAANGDAGMAVLATHMAAAAGALTWSFIEWVKFGKPSALGIVTGMVAGLGTITGASGYVGPGGALVIGLVAGCVCFYATVWFKHTLKIDDSLDVFPVHGIGGIIGTFMAGIFASPALGVLSGKGYAPGMDMGHQVLVQCIGIVSIFTFSVAISWLLLKLTDALVGLRVSPDEETEGLDVVLHNEVGYDIH